MSKQQANIYELTGDNDKDFMALMDLTDEVKSGKYANKDQIMGDCENKILDIFGDVSPSLVKEKMMTSTLGLDLPVKEMEREFSSPFFRLSSTPRQRVDCINQYICAFEYFEQLFEKLHLFDDESDTKRYCYFENELEERIGRKEILRQSPNAEIVKIAAPVGDIYLNHGVLLFENNRIEEARQVLFQAAKYRPGQSEICFELAETYKKIFDMENFCKWTYNGYRVAYKQEQAARVYRNYAYRYSEAALEYYRMRDPETKNNPFAASRNQFFIENENKKWQAAWDLTKMSLVLDNSPHAEHELNFITEHADTKPVDKSYEEMKEFARSIKLTGSVSDEVLSILTEYCESLYASFDNNKAVEYIKILVDYTNDKIWKDRYKEIMSGKHKK